MCLLQFVITVAFFLATCFAAPKCPNGDIEEENATAIIECVNQARRKLASGLQTTANGIYLPPPKNLNDLQWDCEVEKLMAEMVSARCYDDNENETLFWFSHNTMYGESFLENLSKQLARIEDEAPKNITNDAVVYNDIDPDYGPTGGLYYLFVYLHLISARAQKFACIIVGDRCLLWIGEMYVCATDQIYFKNGDIVYEIAKATTSTTTTPKATTSITTTAKARTSTATTSTIPKPVTPSIITSSTASTAESTITQCARPSTTPSCITQSPRRVRREAKAAFFENLLMKKPALTKRRGKTHRKQLRNTPMTLTAHRKHAAKTATGN